MKKAHHKLIEMLSNAFYIGVRAVCFTDTPPLVRIAGTVLMLKFITFEKKCARRREPHLEK